MKRPELVTGCRQGLGVLCLLASLTLLADESAAQEPDESITDNWYKTELLVFIRDPRRERSEDWDPEPQLAYPDEYRFLLDAELADRRLSENAALGSELAENGQQTLRVVTPIEELLYDNRPDALIAPSVSPGDVVSPVDAIPAEPNAPPEPNSPLDDVLPELIPDPNEPVLALAYQRLDSDALEFKQQARSLQRQGHTVVYHAAWWAQLDEDADTLPLLLDRSGDADFPDWPALQGSVHIYRSRYLHVDMNLWLNTLGEYMPPGWSIQPPPLAKASVKALTLAGAAVDLWGRADDAAPEIEAFAGPGAEGGDFPETTATGESQLEPLRAYPWRHAIGLQQTRRMRSDEVHYLDHPVIGVIVRISPASEERSPLLVDKEAARAFRERHKTAYTPDAGAYPGPG